MQHNAAFYQGLHCLLRLKQSPGTGIHYNTCDSLNFTMGTLILIVSIRNGSPIIIQSMFGLCSFISKCDSPIIENPYTLFHAKIYIYHKCSKFNTFLFVFSNKMLVFRAVIHML